MTKMHQIQIGTCLGGALFVCLTDSVFRESLREVLVRKYFTPETQPQVAGHDFVNLAASSYSARRYDIDAINYHCSFMPQNVRHHDILAPAGGVFF